jgi:hypothetical protein
VCDAGATSDEHVPPKSFFPPRLQGKALAIVPACEAHNTANSPDVEYARNVLANQFGSSALADEVADKAFRSWDNSPKLLAKTLQGAEIAHLVDEGTTAETLLMRLDLKRITAVATSIAHALFYIEYGKAWPGTFKIFCTFHSKNSLKGLPDGTEQKGNWFAARPYSERPAIHSDVFRYMFHESTELIFAMCFYDRTWIYARRIGRVIPTAEVMIPVRR